MSWDFRSNQSPSSGRKVSKIEIRRVQRFFFPPCSSLLLDPLKWSPRFCCASHAWDRHPGQGWCEALAGVQIGEEEEVDERGSDHREARGALNPTDVTAEREIERLDARLSLSLSLSAIKAPPYYSASPLRTLNTFRRATGAKANIQYKVPV